MPLPVPLLGRGSFLRGLHAKVGPACRERQERLYMMSSAPELLRHAATLIEQRAASRDRPAERSMKRAIEAFNALTSQSLTELQGWVFMAVLKMARAHAGTLNPDDYLDGAAYMALALEHALGGLGSGFEPAANEVIPEVASLHSGVSGAADEFLTRLCELARPQVAHPESAKRAKSRAQILQEWKKRESQSGGAN